MDIAVSLVQAYLQVNGYFTVAEYPLLQGENDGGIRTLTDLDILAFRFPQAGCEVHHHNPRALSSMAFEPDAVLGVPRERADMIVGEVKQGTAHFNPATWDPLVLEMALMRFGCCTPKTVSKVVKQLRHRGVATTPDGHTVRMIAFGSTGDDSAARYQVIKMGHIVEFLRGHLRRHWGHLGHAQLLQPALAFLALLEKAERGVAQSEASAKENN